METLLQLHLPLVFRFNPDPVPQAAEHKPGEQTQPHKAARRARLAWPRPTLAPMAAITEHSACLAFSFPIPVLLFWLNIGDLLPLWKFVWARGHSPAAALAHTQAFWGVIEASIQMAVSLGSGLTQELLLLVREDCVDSLSSPLSAVQLPFLLLLLLLSHSNSILTSLLFQTHSSSTSPIIPASLHTFISSVSTDSVKQTEDGQTTAPSVGMGWGQSRQGYYNTQTHTHTNSPSHPSLLFMYLSLRSTGWLDFITSTIICLRKGSDREKARQREIEKERGQEGGNGELHHFLKRVHIAKLCHHLTRVHCHGNTEILWSWDASTVFFTLPLVISFY